MFHLRRVRGLEFYQAQRDPLRRCFKPRVELLEDRLAPTISVMSPGQQTSVEGTSTSFNLGSFSDSTPGANSWVADVKWGDGTADTIFTLNSQGSLGSGSHMYGEEGAYNVTVLVTDNANVSGFALFQVAVPEAAVVASAVNFAATPGTAFNNQAVAVFTDPGGAEPNAADPSGTISNHYAALISWGDGTAIATGAITLNGNLFTISGGHTYAQAGTYLFIVTLVHENGPQPTLTGSAMVSNLINFVNFQTSDFSQTAAHLNGAIVTNPALDGNFSLQLLRNSSSAWAEIRQSGTTYYSLNTVFYSFLFRFASQTGDGSVVNFQDTSSNYKAALHLNSAGKLVFYDINGTPLAVGTTVLNANQTYTISAKIGAGSSAPWEVRINGNVEMGGSGNLGNNNNGSIKLGGNNAYTTNYYYDDVAISSQDYPGATLGAAAISFSADEQTVSVSYHGQQRNFYRPVISPWAYQPVRNVYWVATNGSDQNAGTTQAPLRTISQAVRLAGPGDIVYVEAGTYIENLYVTKTGQAGKPIIISCAPGALGKVTITPSAAWVAANPDGSVVEVANNAHYVWINGFVIQGPKGRPEAPTSEHFSANGITWSNGAGFGCQSTNNVVYANVHSGLKEMGHGGSNILMAGNVIFDNGTTSLDHGIYDPANDCTIDGNIIFDNAGWGIHAYSNDATPAHPSPMNLRITRNISIGNWGGLVLAGGYSQVYNNVIAYNKGWGMDYFRDLCVGNVVKNNIFAFNGAGGTDTDDGLDNGGGAYGTPKNNIDDYNCIYPTIPDLRLPPGSHEIYANPQFVNAALGDFRLAPGSPCIGGGTNVGLPFQGQNPNVGPFNTGSPAPPLGPGASKPSTSRAVPESKAATWSVQSGQQVIFVDRFFASAKEQKSSFMRARLKEHAVASGLFHEIDDLVL